MVGRLLLIEDSPWRKTIIIDSPSSSYQRRSVFGEGRRTLHARRVRSQEVFRLCPAKNDAQFLLSVFQNSFLFFRQIFSRAIDVEVQHRHCGLVRCASTPLALFCGMFQRTGNLVRIL